MTLFKGNPTTIQCILCDHFIQGSELRCKAFPFGIPEEILTDKFQHNKPHPEDNGIQFKPRRKVIRNHPDFNPDG